MKKPNIIIFNPDQMRADSLNHLGNLASYTPNFDKLSEEGVSFRNAFCQNTVCVPSRCSFITGLYPHVNGHRTMSYLLRRGEDNLFLDLKKHGYYTVSSSRGDLLAGQDREYNKQCVDEYIKFESNKCKDLNKYSPKRGDINSDDYFSFYEGVIPTENKGEIAINLDDLTIDGAIHSIKNRPKDKPFFMFVGLVYPHPPYQIEQKFLNLIDKNKLTKRCENICDSDLKPSMEVGLEKALKVNLWSEERLGELKAVYLGMCAKVDYQLGQLIDALENEGIYDDTVIICFSDHGDYTGDYGIVEKAQNCFPDCLTNVPLVIKPQKAIHVENGVNEKLVELTDICETCASLAGFKIEREQFGRSLLPTMQDKSVVIREFVSCEGGRLENEEQASEFCKETYNPKSQYAPRQLLQSQIPQHTKATMIRTKEFKYVKRLYESDEFYDLSVGEKVNEINNEKYFDTIKNLKEMMLTWYMETCDIVPKDFDSRFPDEFLFNNMRANGSSEEKIEELFQMMKSSGKSAGDIVAEMLKGHC